VGEQVQAQVDVGGVDRLGGQFQHGGQHLGTDLAQLVEAGQRRQPGRDGGVRNGTSERRAGVVDVQDGAVRGDAGQAETMCDAGLRVGAGKVAWEVVRAAGHAATLTMPTP
jgi:hypothetical protein